MARPTKGVAHVDRLVGTAESKRRAQIILRTLPVEVLSVNEACEAIEVGPTQFANLREQALQGLLDALQPLPVGRPKRATTLTEQEVEALQQQLAELERENALLHTRLELAPVLSLRELPPSKSPGRAKAVARAAAVAAGRAVPGPGRAGTPAL